jgi:hypothetical protein
MTKEEAKDYLPLIQALAEGKTIQTQEDDGAWEDVHSPSFWNEPCFYRIKPEFKVIWVNEYPSVFGDYLFKTKEEAEKAAWDATQNDNSAYRCQPPTRIAVRYVETPE